jgi:RNA polymerase sigma factor (sigma-70 family)
MGDRSQTIGAEARFEAIVQEYRGLLRKVIAQTCPHDLGLQISDIEQDACLRLWRAIQSERELTNPSSYIYRVAFTATIDAVRRVIARHEEQLRVESRDEPGTEGLPPADKEQSPDRVVERRRVAAVIDASLARLADNRRRAVELYLQGLGNQEIADLLDWSEPKARNLIYRGLADLRKYLRAEGIDYE